MRVRIAYLCISCLLVAALVLTSCGPAEEEEEEGAQTVVGQVEEVGEEEEETKIAETKVSTTPSDKPQYGGRIKILITDDPQTFDPYWLVRVASSEIQSLWLETLGTEDWARPDECLCMGTTPIECSIGSLAESWEQPDENTYIFHIRKGVRWQNKPPANGRELTASDIEYTFHRELGLGSGYTEPSPSAGNSPDLLNVISVEATDKYTVVFKTETPSLITLPGFLTEWRNRIVNRETVEQYGDLKDWKNAIGTGPFMLVDYIPGASLTFNRNPDYWGWDERHPENRIPYVDGVDLLVIPNQATGLAALRAGRLDDMVYGMYSPFLEWEQLERLLETNPEMQYVKVLVGGRCVSMRVDREPYTDVRVRKALQMAIDHDAIAESYLGGITEGTPSGMIHPIMKEMAFTYDEWPQELKDEYTYNPEKAKQLLAEAGYPNGFKTELMIATNMRIEMAEIVKGYLANVGVDMTILPTDPATRSSILVNQSYNAMTWSYSAFRSVIPIGGLVWRTSDAWYNPVRNNDPVYDEMVEAVRATTDRDELNRLFKEADEYILRQHWALSMPLLYSFGVYQPWLKGRLGNERTLGGGYNPGPIYARLWVDQALKESMGY
jgi:peptide/nickel transport system substrate-binding protein